MRAADLNGSSPKFQAVLDQVAMVASAHCSVLIQGETGTGKELVARAIHDASPRRDQPFVAVNCAAIPSALLENELFGHDRGAFTGAVTQTKGRFQAANGGTLFLDEIGDLPLELQPKLLRVLQERKFEALGSGESIHVDVRVLVATHQDLWRMVQEDTQGGFPRSWKPGTGEVLDSSPQSSYNPIPFLVLLAQETGQQKYLNAAERAANFTWNQGQFGGVFVGGTIDNPDVLDKEAGTLSTEAYIALYEATHDSKWLTRARAAANYAETWIYLWNVPMPQDEDNRLLHWKKGVPTHGTQLIATGRRLHGLRCG